MFGLHAFSLHAFSLHAFSLHAFGLHAFALHDGRRSPGVECWHPAIPREAG